MGQRRPARIALARSRKRADDRLPFNRCESSGTAPRSNDSEPRYADSVFSDWPRAALSSERPCFALRGAHPPCGIDPVASGGGGSYSRPCASELHQVVAFDGLSQFDSAANWVQWHFLEPYDSALEALAVRGIPKEETVAWWVYQNQQPVVIPFVIAKRVFRCGRAARQIRASFAVCPSAEHGTPKVGKPSLCQPPRRRIFRRGSTVLVTRCQSDRCRNGRCSCAAAFEASSGFHQSDREQAGLARPASARLSRVSGSLCNATAWRGSPGSGRWRITPLCCRITRVSRRCRSSPVSRTDSRRSSGRASRWSLQEEVAADPRSAMGIHSLCLYPLISRERVLGVFGVAQLARECLHRG